MSLNLEFFSRATNITARVIADSINLAGQRITTFEIEYPRFILAELNTHKALEKNSSSSRAIPIKVMIEQLLGNGAMPLYWGTTKSGMQAGEEPERAVINDLIGTWDLAKGWAIKSAMGLNQLGLHKQTANRLLEPFQMMKTVITGTDWDNFFNLRIHPDAQPEFCMLAFKMYQAMQESTPVLLKAGEWHLPYIQRFKECYPVNFGEPNVIDEDKPVRYFIKDENNEFTELALEEAQRVSASCCAQTSYRKSDDSLEKADRVFDLLVSADVLHASPFGHLATPVAESEVVYQDSDYVFEDPKYDFNKSINVMHLTDTWQTGVTHVNRQGVFCSGNLQGWISYRHLMPNNTCYEFNFEERMKMFDTKN